MKKLFAVLLSLLFVFTLFACGNTPGEQPESPDVEQSPSTEVPPVESPAVDEGWITIDLEFTDSIHGVLKGEFSYNPNTMEWKANYDTPYGRTDLGGTYNAEGNLTLVDDSSGGFAANSMDPINDSVRAVLTGGEVSEWVTIDLEFTDSIHGVLKGEFSYNSNTMEWKANYDTPYGRTDLGGTYDADGTLTLVDDSSGGFAANSMGPINDSVRAVLTGGEVSEWVTIDLEFTDSIHGVLKGEFSYNSNTMEWKANYDTPYGRTDLGGTYDADGTLTLVDDSSGGFAANSMGPINDSVRAVLAGGEVSEWVTIDLEFTDSIHGVLKGEFSYNAGTMEWKANYDTPYGRTDLGGTYDTEGNLTLVDDSSGGFAANSMGPINDAVRGELTK